MSNLKVNSINDASGGSTAVLYGVAAPTNSMGFRNRIINGDMRIDQRNAGASVTPTSNGTYTLDRFAAYLSVASKYSVQQNGGAVTPPVGFRNYLGVTSLSAYTVGSSEDFSIRHLIEGYNIADLAQGTASASSMTLSFQVYSSLTGTFGGSLLNNTGLSYPFSYTVSTANTWTTINITVFGSTSGTWNNTTSAGLVVVFSLGTGSTYRAAAGSWQSGVYLAPSSSVSVVGTSGATFYITGVQLEAGSVASPFERRDYGRELMMCQRYFEILAPAYVMFPWNSGAQVIRVANSFQVTKRAAPTVLMRTKAIGTGTMAVVSTTTSGVVYGGVGNTPDVVGYDAPTAESEL